MSSLHVKRVLTVPSTPDPSTLYIVKSSTAGLAELYFSNEDGSDLRHVLTEADVAAVLSSASVASAAKLTTARNINGVPFDGTANITINAVDSTARIAAAEKGAANGVATLDANSLVPVAQIPTSFANVVEGATLANFPGTGSTLKLYVALNTNAIYRWDSGSSTYVQVGGGTLPDTITAGGFPFVNFDTKGLITSGRNLVAADIPNLPGSKITSALSVDTSGNAATATKLATARTINGQAFDGTANITINAVDSTARIASSEKGVANGVATLDSNGFVPASQLPSYVDDVLEYANQAAFPGTGDQGKIYVAQDTNKIYRWSGSAYIEISPTAGNADTATKLATARSISLSGDASWTVNFDGSANVTAALTLANVVTAQASGFYKFAFNSKGLITASSAVGSGDITGALGFTPVNKAGDTMSGDLTIAKASPNSTLDATAGTTAYNTFSVAGNKRWTEGKDSSSETGSNAGSNYVISRYTDLGVLIDTPFTINRATGFVGIGVAASERLTVGESANSTNLTVGLRTKNGSSASTRAAITQEATTGSLRVKVDADGNGTESALILENATGEIARTNAAKQVMVGTTTPTDGAKVTVNGTVSVATGTANTHAVNKLQLAAAFDEILHPFMFLAGVANA